MSLQITINLPNAQHAIEWIDSLGVKQEELDMFAQHLATNAVEYLREAVSDAIAGPSMSAFPKEPASGQTVASLTFWQIYSMPEMAIYKVGSQTRGAQLYWLNMGRRAVYPIRAKKLAIKKGKVFPPIFADYAQPSLAYFVLQTTGNRLLQNAMTLTQVFLQSRVRS